MKASRRARATARAGADELVGELVVAVQMGFDTRQLPGALNALRRRFPRLEVTVFEEPSSTELEQLGRRGVLTATAVRWGAHGLGVTLVPASAVPHGHEHLVRPVFPVVSQPVIAVVRQSAGPAETALLELLRQETWSESASFSPVS